MHQKIKFKAETWNPSSLKPGFISPPLTETSSSNFVTNFLRCWMMLISMLLMTRNEFEVVLCHWLPNWWTNKVISACIYARSWSTFCDVILRVRFMPEVVTVRNASSTHKISAACLLNDAGMVKTWRIHEILILRLSKFGYLLAAVSLALIFIEWISV